MSKDRVQDPFERIYKYIIFLQYDWGHKTFEDWFSLRKTGHVYSLREHLESMIISLLSANRPWGQIEANLDNLSNVFRNYEPDYLYEVSPFVLISGVTSLGCGNRRIDKQMSEIKGNIDTFRRIEKDFGSVDYFCQVAQDDVFQAVYSLSNSDSPYKLKGIGEALVFQYLKQLGIDCVKPDVHLVRILERLGYFEYKPSFWEVYDVCSMLADCYPELYMADVGAILWNFCAVDYLNICGAAPMCRGCPVQCCYSQGTSDEAVELQDIMICYDWKNRPYLSEATERGVYQKLGTDDISCVANYLRGLGKLDSDWY